MKKITIVGAGLVGSLLSMYLAKKGHVVDVYERRPDMRLSSNYAGRSINLALSDRGWRGLEEIGVVNDIKKIAIPMSGRMMHPVSGECVYQPYGVAGQAINSVSRSVLNMTLLDCAERYENIRIHFNQRAVDTDIDAPWVQFENTITGDVQKIESNCVIGSDGAFSAIRDKMQKSDRYNYSQDYLDHAYKELSIPPAEDGSFRLEKHALHIWARHSYLMIALPNNDGSFTCTLFLAYTSDDPTAPSFDKLTTPEAVMEFFAQQFPDVLPMMPTLVHDFFENPTSSLVTMRAYPWVWKDKAALIGDAAHALVPFYGQGMNAGFEDCIVLSECIDAFPDNWSTAFAQYQHLRKPDGDAIAQLALDNFIEMRDKVAQPHFLLRKKIEAKIHERYPKDFTPLYTLVTFSPDVRYSQALKQGHDNDVLIEQLLEQVPDVLGTWETDSTQTIIKELLKIA